QHLELETGGGDALVARERPGVLDDAGVVRGDAGIRAPQEQPLHAAHVGRIHVPFVGERDRRGLLVGALAEPHARAERDHLLHVLQMIARGARVRLCKGAYQEPATVAIICSTSCSVRRRYDCSTTPTVFPNSGWNVRLNSCRVRSAYSDCSMSMRTNEPYVWARAMMARRLSTHSRSSMSSPIWVSLSETFAAAPAARMRSSVSRYVS